MIYAILLIFAGLSNTEQIEIKQLVCEPIISKSLYTNDMIYSIMLIFDGLNDAEQSEIQRMACESTIIPTYSYMGDLEYNQTIYTVYSDKSSIEYTNRWLIITDSNGNPVYHTSY